MRVKVFFKRTFFFLTFFFFLLLAKSGQAQEASRVAVIWLPQTLTPNKESLLVLNIVGSLDWEVRLYVKQEKHYSGSVKVGDSFSSGYVSLANLTKDGRLIFIFKVSSVLSPGEAEWRLALRKPETSKKLGEISLGKVKILESFQTIQGKTEPDAEVGLFVSDSDKLPYTSTIANESGEFSLNSDKTGKLYILRETGRKEELTLPSDSLENQTTFTKVKVFISAVLPNPKSPATDSNDEWIEIATTETTPQDISGYILSDTQGTVHRYTLPAGSLVLLNQPLKIYSKESRISLNNDRDKVILLSPNGEILSETKEYENAPEGGSWIFDGKDWLWEIDEESAGEEGKEVALVNTGGNITSQETPKEVAIAEIPKLQPGVLIQVEGMVSGKTSTGFYLADSLGNKIRVFLAQAFRSLKEKIQRGELWQVIGKLEVYAGSLRLSPKSEMDLKKLKESAKEESATKAIKSLSLKESTGKKTAEEAQPSAQQQESSLDKENKTERGSQNKRKSSSFLEGYPLTQVASLLALLWGLLLKLK